MTSAEIFLVASLAIFLMNIALSIWVMRQAASTLDHATRCLRALIEIADPTRAPRERSAAA